MNRNRWSALVRVWAVLAALGIVLSLAGGFSSAAAHRRQPPPTPPVVTPFPGAAWTLIDNRQSTCYFFPQSSTDTNYYGIWIQGSWTHQINIGVSKLPAGAVTWTSFAPIPAGSSDGIGSLAYVAVQLPSTTQFGTYTATLWANDGSVTEGVPVVLTVQSNCGGY
jgi:hypothetical protein